MRGWHGRIGCVLAAVAWLLNWGLPGPRTHVLFFPLWLGYILAVDGLVLHRRGHSLLTRSPRDFALLFGLSVPIWWLFELINWRTGNWEYLGRELFGEVAFVIIASLSFSTVLPAVLETSELVGSFGWIERFARGLRVNVTPQICWVLFLAGWAMLTLLLALPHAFYPFAWTFLIALGEPLNVWRGRPSLLTRLCQGDWRPVVALGSGALICGFFWEMWNYFSYPKWVYHIPVTGYWPLFEMPVLGYLGYPAFGLELYVITQLVRRRALDLPIG